MDQNSDARPCPATTRRGFLGLAAGAAMGTGLVAGYGTLGGLAVRYLYPARSAPSAWMYVAEATRIARGEAFAYKTPVGHSINIARQGDGDGAEDFIALSSVCPHLGCQVYWEPHNDRFFCPCHNGVFDSSGFGTGGPPKGQTLLRYDLKVEDGLLFIEVPVEGLSAGGEA